MPEQTQPTPPSSTDESNDTDEVPDTDEAPDTDASSGAGEAGSADEADRYPKLDDVEYDRVNAFLREYVTFTAREWAVARLCADFRTGTGVEMKTVGERLPDLVPFVTEEYTRQEVYQARRSFEEKVREAAATFLYGAYAGVLTADEVDEVMYEGTEVAKFLLEVEGESLSLDEERAAEERATDAMRSVHDASVEVRYDRCPHCGEQFDDGAAEDEAADGGGADDGADEDGVDEDGADEDGADDEGATDDGADENGTAGNGAEE